MDLKNENIDVNLPLKSDEETVNTVDLPPPYEYPKVDFNSGWKDIGFAIAFWIQAIAVLVVSLVLGSSVAPSTMDSIDLAMTEHDAQHKDSTYFYIKVLAFSVIGAAIASSTISIMTFFLLQLYAARIIICTFIFTLNITAAAGIILLITLHWIACIGPLLLFIITLIFFFIVRKRIRFAAAHLQIACAVLRSHLSIIPVTVGIFILEFIWLILCLLLAIGVHHTLDQYEQNTQSDQPVSHKEPHGVVTLRRILGFFLFLVYSWGTVTLKNIVHFIAACSVGHWWFGTNSDDQYRVGISIKRAFSTSFGTICFGSLLEAIVKAVRSSTERKSRAGIFSCIATCILRIVEKIIGYINEWGIVYAALTGQTFVESSRSFIELFKKRGWTMLVNDTLAQNCLHLVNFLASLISAGAGGIIAYMFSRNLSTEDRIPIIVTGVASSFLIGILFSIIMATIFTACIRTVFVCFAINPAALGATHPKQLQLLTKTWYKFHPNEFTTSGYASYYPKVNGDENV